MRLVDIVLKIILYASVIAALGVLLLHNESYDVYNLDGKSIGLMWYVIIIIIANALHNEAIADYKDLNDYNARLEESIESLRKLNRIQSPLIGKYESQNNDIL